MSSVMQLKNPPRSGSSGSEAILAAVVFGAQKFLNEPDWADLLQAWLQQLGAATGATQVRVFANDASETRNNMRASMCAQWIAPGANPGWPMSELQHISYEEAGCARWLGLLSKGAAVVGNLHELGESERPIMQAQGNVSVAIVPVFVESRWWGFI